MSEVRDAIKDVVDRINNEDGKYYICVGIKKVSDAIKSLEINNKYNDVTKESFSILGILGCIEDKETKFDQSLINNLRFQYFDKDKLIDFICEIHEEGLTYSLE